MSVAAVIFPIGFLLFGFFEDLLGGNHDAAVFLKSYFDFIGIWIGFFLVVIIIRFNRPMLNAVKYCSPRVRSADSVGRKGNRAYNNIRGLVFGLALGFGCNGFCILMSVLFGDIHLEYSGFKLTPCSDWMPHQQRMVCSIMSTSVWREASAPYCFSSLWAL